MRCKCGTRENWIEKVDSISHFWKCTKCEMVGHEPIEESGLYRTQIYLDRQQVRFIDWKIEKVDPPKPTRSEMIRIYLDLGIATRDMDSWLEFRKFEEKHYGK